MKIRDIGGEFELLKILHRKCSIENSQVQRRISVPNGDDAAVVQGEGSETCISVDTLVEERHFSFRYFSPEQVGSKAIEAAASDLIAMRVRPEFVLLAVSLPDDTEVERVTGMYAGVAQSCERLGCMLVGGDLTSCDSQMVISVTALGGRSRGRKLSLRSGAKPGEGIYVSGVLGGSHAGLKVFLNGCGGFDEAKLRHVTPRCRVDSLDWRGDFIGACIDISDGLSSELHHLAAASGVGMVVEEQLIPIDPVVSAVATYFEECPLDYALHGGEDFELLFTAPESGELPPDCIRIGRVQQAPGVWLESNGERKALPAKGSNRFM